MVLADRLDKRAEGRGIPGRGKVRRTGRLKRRKRRRRFLKAVLLYFAAAVAGIYVIISLKGTNTPIWDAYMSSIGGRSILGGIDKTVFYLLGHTSLEEAGDGKKTVILANQMEKWKPYMDIRVTYCFGSKREVLDGSTIVQWLDMDHKGDVTIDRSKVEEYVRELSVKYNTAYCTKKLETSYGQVVSITKGHYGWMIDKKSETEALIGIIQSGASQEREPVYLQTAASHDGPDFGNTYVEMNLTSQHMFFYKEGKLLIESDFVSGDEAKGFRTPAGAYEITYKQMNATLKGKDYKTPVTYWMPFNGNIGMHDGYWRTSFGGTIYKANGSHGCVNLPPSVAKTVYENINAGTPVLCYYLEGTESKKTSTYSEGKAEKPSGRTNDSPQTTEASTVILPAETAAVPLETAAMPPETADTPPETADTPADTSAAPADTSAGPTETAAVRLETAAVFPETAAIPSEKAVPPSETAVQVFPGENGTASLQGPGDGL